MSVGLKNEKLWRQLARSFITFTDGCYSYYYFLAEIKNVWLLNCVQKNSSRVREWYMNVKAHSELREGQIQI